MSKLNDATNVDILDQKSLNSFLCSVVLCYFNSKEVSKSESHYTMGGELELTFDGYNDDTNGEAEEIASEAAGMLHDICFCY